MKFLDRTIGPMVGLGLRALGSNLGRLSLPYKLTIAITERCNGRCLTCSTWKRPPRPDLPAEALEGLLVGAEGASWIDITGGEIFLRPDLERVVDGVVRRSPRLYLLHFPTNGLLTRPVVALLRSIQAWGVPRVIVSISLDGPPATHDRLRGVAGAFERALATYREVQATGVEVYLGMTLSRQNSGLYEPTLDLLAGRLPGFGPRDLHINLAHGAHLYGNVGTPLTDVSTAHTVARALELRPWGLSPVGWLERIYLKNCQAYLQDRLTPLPCQALGASCFIDASGAVFPCTTWGEKVGQATEAGGLARVWRSPKAQSLRLMVRAGACPHCWTPCEAYQSILGSLTRTGLNTLGWP